MNQTTFAVAVLFALMSMNAMADISYEFVQNAPSAPAPKKIQGNTAGGEQQTTIIDENGNLKIVDQPNPKNNNSTQQLTPSTTNMGPPAGSATTAPTPPAMPTPAPTSPATPTMPNGPMFPAAPTNPSAVAAPTTTPSAPTTPNAPATSTTTPGAPPIPAAPGTLPQTPSTPATPSGTTP